MKIYCINNDNERCKLILGKEYTDLQSTESDRYIVIAEDGLKHSYKKDKFTTDKKLAMKILDRVNNPSEYFDPLYISVLVDENEYQISSVKIKIIHIDESLLGIGNFYKFLNIEPSYGISINSSTKYAGYNEISGFLQIGKMGVEYETLIKSFKDNRKAVEFAYKISKSIEEINDVLIYKKKEKKLAYLVEHEPNGKRYLFRGEELYIHELVHCDTTRGLQYGVIVGTEMIDGGKWHQLKECKHIYTTNKINKEDK